MARKVLTLTGARISWIRSVIAGREKILGVVALVVAARLLVRRWGEEAPLN